LKSIILGFVIFVSSFTNKIFPQVMSLGGGFSLPTYWGDLNSNKILKDLKNNSNIGLNIGLNFEMSRMFSINGGIVYGKMQGDDAKSHQAFQIDRNLNFFTNLFESNAGLQFHPFAWRVSKSGLILIPFAQLNLGLIYTNPKTTFNGEVISLQPLGTEGQGMDGFGPRYNLWNISGGAGGGLKFLLNEKLTLIVDSRLMLTNTDYLDDVGRFYVNFQELRAGNGLLAAQLSDRTPEVRNINEPLDRPTGSQRGGSAKDMYFISSVSLFYNIRNFSGKSGFVNKNKVICPKFN
jgi:hypothetical protein